MYSFCRTAGIFYLCTRLTDQTSASLIFALSPFSEIRKTVKRLSQRLDLLRGFFLVLENGHIGRSMLIDGIHCLARRFLPVQPRLPNCQRQSMYETLGRGCRVSSSFRRTWLMYVINRDQNSTAVVDACDVKRISGKLDGILGDESTFFIKDK